MSSLPTSMWMWSFVAEGEMRGGSFTRAPRSKVYSGEAATLSTLGPLPLRSTRMTRIPRKMNNAACT